MVKLMSSFEDTSPFEESFYIDLTGAAEASILKSGGGRSEYLSEELISLLKTFQGKRVHYFVNPGNVGDYLIELGSLTLLRSFEIEIHITTSALDCAGEVVFFQGGGGFNELYTVIEEILIQVTAANPKKIIVLPSTIFELSPAILGLRHSDVLVTRDQQSFDILTKASLEATVLISHDLGFFADLEGLIVDEATYNTINKRLALESKVAFPKLDEGIVGFLLREDLESAVEKVEGSVDISSYYSWLEPQDCRLNRLVCFLTYIKQYQLVITDRLHVAIACHLMKIPCRLIENSYGKNSAVASFSLFDSDSVRFEKTFFQDEVYLTLLKLNQKSKVCDELTQQRDELTQQRDEILNSTIWRMTKPIRWFIGLLNN